MANVNAEKAAAIIESVGGKENITLASHCMTRLRLTLKDESLANDDVVKRIDGIIGVVHAGGQYQNCIARNWKRFPDFLLRKQLMKILMLQRTVLQRV